MPIPQLDPMPVPAPLWLVRTLLLMTFTLHLLLMNTLLGGAVVALVCRLRRATSKYPALLASDLAHMLPATFAFTITVGIAPLLFLQVIYGHLLYTSSILMGVPWLSIIGLVLCAYYAVYYFALRGERKPVAANAVLAGAVLLLAAVAFIYSNNFTLMLAPGRWLDLYERSSGGWNLNLSEPTLLPRYLHFVLSAFAVTGLVLLVLGLKKRGTGYGRWLIEQGSILFTLTTIVNMAVGCWFLMRIPADVRSIFSGKNGLATAALAAGFLLPLAAITHLVLMKTGKAVVRNSLVAVGSGALTVVAMVVVREAVRNAYLAPYFRPEQLKVAPPWGVIGLFLVIFVAGLAALAYMLRAVAVANRAAVTQAAIAGRR
jgi:hypothetical protein